MIATNKQYDSNATKMTSKDTQKKKPKADSKFLQQQLDAMT